MTRQRLSLWVAAAICGVVVVAAASCSPAGGLCRAAADCTHFDLNFQFLDTVGTDDDSEGVCEADYQGQINALRANSDSICQTEADELEKFLSCAADAYNKDPGRACDIVSISTANPCQGELKNLSDTQQNAGDKCGEDQT
jgi:hypothetical protein